VIAVLVEAGVAEAVVNRFDQVAAVVRVQAAPSHAVWGKANPPRVCINVCSCTVMEYPLPAFVETTRSWQPVKNVLTGKRVPKGTDVGDVSTADTVAPSSAVQFTAFTLETVKARLSATATCTVTAELMDTSMLPDPPKVPPTEMV